MTKIKIYFFLIYFLVVGAVYGLYNILNIDSKWGSINISFNSIFLFFAISSFLLLVVNFILYKKYKEQLGYIFLILFTIKVVVAYIITRTIEVEFQKKQAIILFFIFLIIDVFFTAKLLNLDSRK